MQVIPMSKNISIPCPECDTVSGTLPRDPDERIECPNCGAHHRGPDTIETEPIMFNRGDVLCSENDKDREIKGFARYTGYDDHDGAWMFVVDGYRGWSYWLVGSIIVVLQRDNSRMSVERDGA